MAIVNEGCLKCPGCGEYVIEADPAEYPDGVDYQTPGADEAKTKCGGCLVADGDVGETDRSLRTIVADWESVEDDAGYSISPDMLPVVITVKATSRNEALEAASDKLQEHFGSDVEPLYAQDIERHEWFGLDGSDAFLRINAVFVGEPEVENDDRLTTVIR